MVTAGACERKVMSAEIIEAQPQAVAPANAFNVEALISEAIKQGTPVDTMERILAMRRELKAEFAKEAFDKAMAKFQSECPVIQKTKEVKTDSGKIAYRYAPIESIVEQVKLPLQANGFSYSTNMELLESGVRVSVKVTHAAGHSESTEMTVPLGNKTNIMSASQVVAAAQTFAKRYAFCNAFGILTGDEDNDGQDMGRSTPKTNTLKAPKVTDAQLTKIKNLAEMKNYVKEDIVAKCKEMGFNTLDKTSASKVIDWLVNAPVKEDLPAIQTDDEEKIDPELRAIANRIDF
jgi:hypothetical protein